MSENLLRVLAEEPPPTRLDAEFLAHAGRRRVRARRTGAVAAAGAVTAFAIGATALALPDSTPDRQPTGTPSATRSAVPPIQDAPCTVQALRSPKGDVDLGIADMDDSGRYILGVYSEGSLQGEAVLWVDGETRTLPRPSGSQYGWTGVNGSGILIGVSALDGRQRPWVYRDGRFTRLALPAGAIGGQAIDLNNAGQIVGSAEWPGTTPAEIGVIKTVRWHVDTPNSVEVLPSTTKWAEPRSIAADGTVVGTLDDGGSPYLWRPDGRGEALPGYERDDRGKAIAIAGDYATGWTYLSTSKIGSTNNVRWNVRTGQVTLAGIVAPAAIAADGTVAGNSSGGGHAALERDGITYLLPLLDLPGRTGPAFLSRISVDGRTVAGSHSTTTHNVPTRWRC